MLKLNGKDTIKICLNSGVLLSLISVIYYFNKYLSDNLSAVR